MRTVGPRAPSEPSRAEPGRAGPSRAGPNRNESNWAEPSRAGPNRNESNWAEPSRAESIRVRLNVMLQTLDPFVEFFKGMSKVSLSKRVVGTASRINSGHPWLITPCIYVYRTFNVSFCTKLCCVIYIYTLRKYWQLTWTMETPHRKLDST
jgi:hypothetical protein